MSQFKQIPNKGLNLKPKPLHIHTIYKIKVHLPFLSCQNPRPNPLVILFFFVRASWWSFFRCQKQFKSLSAVKRNLRATRKLFFFDFLLSLKLFLKKLLDIYIYSDENSILFISILLGFIWELCFSMKFWSFY